MGVGSMRRRGRDALELRVYLGTDAETGRRRWATRTVHGSPRHAHAQLVAFVEEAGYSRLRAGTVRDLLERWFDAAAGMGRVDRAPDPLDYRLPSRPPPRASSSRKADDCGRRRLLRPSPSCRWTRRTAT